MPYTNGREIKNGDKVVLIRQGQIIDVAVVYDAATGTVAKPTQDSKGFNLSKWTHEEDVMAKITIADMLKSFSFHKCDNPSQIFVGNNETGEAATAEEIDALLQKIN